MILHVWSILCTRSVIDSSTNNISLIDVLEQLNVNMPQSVSGSEPVVPINYEFVSYWIRGDVNATPRGRARLILMAANREQIGNPSEYDVDLSNFVRLRTKVQLSGFPI